jgi:flavorubredoxin
MKSTVLYEEGGHKWIAMARDDSIDEKIIDTVQYLVVSGKGALLVDPGGIEIFPHVLTEVLANVDIEQIGGILASHQDPDIASSMSLWADICPGLVVNTPWLWEGFVRHFCMGAEIEIKGIPDQGAPIHIGNSSQTVQAIPAHYCHSSGNVSVWDQRAKILWSGDIGAALLPSKNEELFVEDFDDHVQYMEGFHMRWMPANRPLRAWVAQARELKPDMICPQHGSIFRGENVEKFLNWLEHLDVEALDPSRPGAIV